jgi:hypothetical protein
MLQAVEKPSKFQIFEMIIGKNDIEVQEVILMIKPCLKY